MRGTWDDVNRRLTSTLLALDLDDAITVGDRVDAPKRRLFGGRPPAPPRRFVQVTAARSLLIAECVGSTSFGGDWPMDAEIEASLLRQGWERPWTEDGTTFVRDAALINAPRLSVACVRALRTLGCTVEGLDVTLTREDPSD